MKYDSKGMGRMPVECEKQRIASSESLRNSGCLVTLGKLPNSGGGEGCVCFR